jgi:hypothetical protein
MGREVRMVPKDWEHPIDNDGLLIPLLADYQRDARDFLAKAIAEGLEEAVDYFGCTPDKSHYMPELAEGEVGYYCMYENTSEGTPISPSFATPEELARWLADNNASAFGGSTASYEGWLRVAKGACAPSCVVIDGQFVNGVDATR